MDDEMRVVKVTLSHEQIEQIADAVADRSWQRIQIAVGKGVLKNLLFLIGIGAVSLYAIFKIKSGDWK